MNSIKAALLGVEHPHSRAHLRTLQMLPEVESIFLWDESELALQSVMADEGDKVEATYTNLADLLARDDLFFVIAAVRNDLGPAIFTQVLDAGKHLLAEKPIGRSAAETEQVLGVANRTGLTLGVCYQNRANPVLQDARNIVSQGLLGPLMSVEIRMITTQVQFRNPQHWLFKQEHSGGGMLSWLGCHYIDMLRFITGEEIVSVSAEVATRSGEAIDVEDVATLSMRLQSGAVASLHVGYILALSGSGYHNSNGYDTYTGINGQLGRITWSASGQPTQMDVESVHPDWSGAPRRTFEYEYGRSAAYGGVYGEQFVREFIQAAQGTGPVPASAEDALKVAHVVDAAYKSSQTGHRIDL